MDRLSAFMDGEASRREAKQALGQLKDSGDCYETWYTFHLIGDIMRNNRALPIDFTPRFQALIEQEPTIVAPRYTLRKTTDYALAAAASFTAIAVVGGLMLADFSANTQAPQVAVVSQSAQVAAVQSPAPVLPAVAQVEPQPIASQGRANEYLMAHQEFSPSTTFQGVAPYVRTVSASRPDSSR